MEDTTVVTALVFDMSVPRSGEDINGGWTDTEVHVDATVLG